MILRRLSANLKDQNWTAVAVEFVLVVLGVFLGIAAANWNEERLAKRETDRLLSQLDEELSQFVGYIGSVEAYYRSAGGYGDRAAAAWTEPRAMSDSDFVIAAYQASQVTGVANNAEVWGAIFGAENLRDIDDPVVRQNLAAVMTFDFDLTNLGSVSSRYRQEVRKAIPDTLQRSIRTHCGDRATPNGTLVLPARCDLQLPAGAAALTAAALRARPELVNELYWHRAAVANQLSQAAILKGFAETLIERID